MPLFIDFTDIKAKSKMNAVFLENGNIGDTNRDKQKRRKLQNCRQRL